MVEQFFLICRKLNIILRKIHEKSPPYPPPPTPPKKKLALKHKKGIYKLKIAKISKRKSKPKNKDMQQNL